MEASMNVQKMREEVIFLARRQPEIAMKRANALVKEFPNEVWTWSLCAHVYDTKGEIRNAIADIDRAIEIRYQEPGTHFSRGRFYLQIKDYRNAIISFSNSINIGIELQFLYHDSISRFMRSFCYCKIGDFDSALKDLDVLDDDMESWIDQPRSKTELLDACSKGRLD
jgi:tetratricopeptide (TPR) repeat protein